MIGFRSLGRWRSEALLEAADRLEGGHAVAHFGHLHNVPVVVDALRHAAELVGAARNRAFETADLILAQGWRFRAAGNEVVVQEVIATEITYDELERIEDQMGVYAGAMADALTDIEIALDELYAVIEAARRAPDARGRPQVRRPLRPTSAGRACRDRRRDPWPWCWDR
jgi:hypothetical protein